MPSRGRRGWRWLVGLVAPLPASLALAAIAVPAPGFDIQTWRSDDGLPSDMVNAIAQGPDGYLWIATTAGLARFDGVRFETRDRTTVPQLASDDCLRLGVTRDGALWIATVGGAGFTRLANGRFSGYARAEGVEYRFALEIRDDGAGTTFIGSDRALFAWRDGRIVRHPGCRFPVAQDARGRMWFGSPEGMSVWDGAAPRDVAAADLPAETGFVPAAARWPLRTVSGHDGRVWLYEPGAHRVWRTRGAEARAFDFVPAAPGEAATAFLEDRHGALWIGTSTCNLYVLENGAFRLAVTAPGLPGERVSALAEDAEGNVWVGTNAGLSRLRRQAVAMITPREGLADARALVVLEDRQGDVWIGTEAGVQRLHGAQVTSFVERDGLPGRAVVAMAEDREGRLWVGSHRGLAWRDGERFVPFAANGALTDPSVRALFSDSRGRLWIGTAAGGINMLEGGRLRAWRARDGLGSDWVRFVHEDAAGTIWIGTSGGLTRWRDGQVTNLTTRDGLPDDIVLGIDDDGAGGVWIATYNGGLCRLRGGTARPVTTAHGLPGNTVMRLLDDGSGTLWLGTLKGIVRVARSELDAVADGRAPVLSCATYAKHDGLSTTDLGGGSQPAGWRSRDGRLWFPTSRGVAVLDPSRLALNRVAPPVLIEELRGDTRPLAMNGDVVVPAGTRTLELRYTALSFSAPEKVRFRYRLEGYDPDWIDAGPRRAAYYTGLAPGAYAFRVIAANDDGVWNQAGASIALRARPFFYQTGWFAALCVAAAAGLAFAIYRVRLRQVEARFEAVLAERGRIARELHDTVASGFTGVSMQIEAMAARLPGLPPDAAASLDRAREVIRASLADARRSVRALRPRALAEGTLAESLRGVLDDATAGTSVRGEFAERGAAGTIAPAVADHLLRVAQEATSNALRHAACGILRVTLECRAHEVELTVEDDGRGIDNPSPGPGMGLSGMRERIAQLGGTLEIGRGTAGGTRIVATVPRRRSRWSRQ